MKKLFWECIADFSLFIYSITKSDLFWKINGKACENL